MTLDTPKKMQIKVFYSPSSLIPVTKVPAKRLDTKEVQDKVVYFLHTYLIQLKEIKGMQIGTREI